ncbi:MAG: hypothetical protein JST83_14415, partial [Bacteroidetes bacterium]|nr:hypothetical protein [Bacteroidota bacterium]
RTFFSCITISLLLYLVSAWHSAIYLHPDEHYQIVEFASYKMGITHADQMAWEFAEQIRSGAQPLLCYALLRSFEALHITDHYSQLFVLRLLSGLLSLLSLTVLCITALPFIRAEYRRTFIISSFLFWYPYVYGVHFSSETWSACMIMMAISLLVWHYQRNSERTAWLFAGVGGLLGLAFLFRFQTAVISLGILCWLLFVRKERQSLLYLISAGLLVLGLGALTDRWLYEEWVFVPWRYFDAAFIHQHSDFGAQPLYFFPLFFILMLTPALGIVALIALPVAFITQPRIIYTWALLPFIVLHMLVPHKEWRFFYPVISFIPLLVFLAWQGWRDRAWPMPSHILSIGKWSVVIFDIIALALLIFWSDVRFDQKIFEQRIHHLARTGTVMIYETSAQVSPYILPKATIPRDLYPEYLRDSGVHEILVSDLTTVTPHGGDTVTLICTDQYEWPHSKKGLVVRHTRPDMSWLRHIIGDDINREIELNNYYLIRL